MLLEIEEESPPVVVPLRGAAAAGGTFDDRAATADGEAAPASWAIGDPFADDALFDDGNRLFPAEDRGPARGDLVGLVVHDVENQGIAPLIGRTTNARDDDERLRIGRG